ncbi:MAG: type II toxin-antitoxin system Phd/YefM family antitoxin [Actinobacteria bacterium]|nr:type II toxin-antitoxin system Phd/YefM family antitoxin [Actinomycetota bacterium]MCL5883469.1 type II toxin-antitoxin system Phd/YefM family antitoxin [Actinomycetota bacterium]
MRSVLANRSASISELKRNPSALIEESEGEPVAILNHNTPTAYLIPADTYEMIMERIEDYQLGLIVRERQDEIVKAVAVDIDEL